MPTSKQSRRKSRRPSMQQQLQTKEFLDIQKQLLMDGLSSARGEGVVLNLNDTERDEQDSEAFNSITTINNLTELDVAGLPMRLQKLSIIVSSKTHVPKSLGRLWNLRTLSIAADKKARFGSRMSDAMRDVMEDVLRVFGKAAPNLTTLTIANMPILADLQEQIARAFPRLQRLILAALPWSVHIVRLPISLLSLNVDVAGAADRPLEPLVFGHGVIAAAAPKLASVVFRGHYQLKGMYPALKELKGWHMVLDEATLPALETIEFNQQHRPLLLNFPNLQRAIGSGAVIIGPRSTALRYIQASKARITTHLPALKVLSINDDSEVDRRFLPATVIWHGA